jgi:protein-disulfide isomerase
MDRNGLPVIVAALVLGTAIVSSALLVRSSLEQSSEKLDAVIAALEKAPAPAPAAAPAPSRRGLDPNKRYSVDTKGAPTKGAVEGSVEIVEFSDFQCPFCARVNPTLDRIEKEYGDKVRISFKHLPLRIHPKAPEAHAAAEAAHRQGQFWEMHDRIFANQRQLSKAQYEKYAQEMGLDVDQFRTDMASPAVKGKVSADQAEAAKLGVTGTPSFFVNGRYLSGAQPYESFKRLIDEELRKG